MAKIFAITNQKGGVGKTTTAINVASCLAAAERKTLLVDLDPQGNSTSGLGFVKQEITQSIYEVLINEVAVEAAVVSTDLEYLDLLPANTQLVGAELELVSVFARESKLKNALKNLEENYDFILIDCPPSLNLLTVNALTACDAALIPVQCEYFALEGLSELTRTIELIKNHLNPKLEIGGIILTMFDARNNLARQVAEEIRNFFGEKVFQTVIPRNVKLGESPSHGKSIINYDVRSKGAQSYLDLTRELVGLENVQNIVQEGQFQSEVLL